MSDLSTLRDDLDAVDRKLVDALAERQRLVADVAAVKAADGALPIQDPDREQDRNHPVEQIGRELRAMMPWLKPVQM